MQRASGIVASLAIALSATAAFAEIKDWAITPLSDEAAVIMRVPAQPYDYSLTFAREGNTGFMSRVYMVSVSPGAGDHYVGRTLKPGRYVLTTISQQGGRWKSCFAEQAPVIDVKPGKISYLGTLNAGDLLKDLQSGAAARNKAKLVDGTYTIGWKPSIYPAWHIDATELEEVGQYLKEKQPRTTAPVEALAAQSSTVQVSAADKAIKICG